MKDWFHHWDFPDDWLRKDHQISCPICSFSASITSLGWRIWQSIVNLFHGIWSCVLMKKIWVQRPLILIPPLNFQSPSWHFHIICSKVQRIIFCKSNPTFNTLTMPQITCICSTASAQHPSMRKSTEMITLCSKSDIQRSSHKTEWYVLWQRVWCHHTQARHGS